MRTRVITLLWVCMFASILSGQEREFKPRKVGNLFGRFKPIKDFPVIPASESDVDANELVLGVVVNGKARAYPINMLNGPSREILNDELGGTAIAATW
jgi:hypothetical protein